MKKFYLCLFSLFGLVCCIYALNPKCHLQKLKVEYTENPLGLDTKAPRFSWQTAEPDTHRGFVQKAYRIIIKDEENNEVWNSGIVNDDKSVNIVYDGYPLKPESRYNWSLSVWDDSDNLLRSDSWFETGLMNPSYENWEGAEWIGGDDKVFYAHYLPVFCLQYTIQLDADSKSSKAGFIYGTNDSRLTDRNKNLFQIESSYNESYILIEIDISPLTANKNAILNIYRVGYHLNDQKGRPLKSITIPQSILNEQNKYMKHTYQLCSNLGHTTICIDNFIEETIKIKMNPIGQGGDFIAFPVVGDIGFYVPENQAANFTNVELHHFRSPSNCIWRNDSCRIEGGSNGYFATQTPRSSSSPMLRTTFTTTDSIAKARLYITSRGIYDAYINGKLVNIGYFNPGMTQYNKTHLYQTYDVTQQIHNGKNALGIILSEGWWSGGATYTGEYWNYFGDQQSVLVKLVVTYINGEKEVITSNPSSWSYFDKGPTVYGSFFQGEVYDASKEECVNNWSSPIYNDSLWEKACAVDIKTTISQTGSLDYPYVNDYSNYQLIGQVEPCIQVVKELSAISVEEVRPGVFVYDMGQNMVGVPEIYLSDMQANSQVTLRYAEVKYPQLPEYEDLAGTMMLENIRAAMSQDIYITKGGKEIFSPRFTYHGYRYIEVSGISKPLPLESVKGKVLSSIYTFDSDFQSSNDMVNKLWENIKWSTIGNFLSIPTDCPQRNERLGWSGDISVFSRTATYMGNVSLFLRRHLRAMRDVQRLDGRFTDVAPLGGGFGGVLWGSAGITVAWECYQQYEDKALLVEHYSAMKQYINYIQKVCIDTTTNLLVQEKVWGNLGDWLSPEDKRNDKSLLWESYFIYDLELMQKIANILNCKEDAEYFKTLLCKRRKHFNQTYINKENGKTIFSGFDGSIKGKWVDTQTSYALPLVFNIVDDSIKSKFIKNFVSTITRTNYSDDMKECPAYSLMTGFIGTAWICQALSDNKHQYEAYRLLQQTSYPSWLYSVKQGATTIWERLNSYTHTNGFGGNNRMNSFNHYSFGAVGAWMCSNSLGIQRDEESPAFKHFILKPEIDPSGETTFAKGFYDSMYGRIECSWNISKNYYSYDFIIPANTTATLYLPASSLKKIQENDKTIKRHPEIEYLGSENDEIKLRLLSGHYRFKVYK